MLKYLLIIENHMSLNCVLTNLYVNLLQVRLLLLKQQCPVVVVVAVLEVMMIPAIPLKKIVLALPLSEEAGKNHFHTMNTKSLLLSSTYSTIRL